MNYLKVGICSGCNGTGIEEYVSRGFTNIDTFECKGCKGTGRVYEISIRTTVPFQPKLEVEIAKEKRSIQRLLEDKLKPYKP